MNLTLQFAFFILENGFLLFLLYLLLYCLSLVINSIFWILTIGLLTVIDQSIFIYCSFWNISFRFIYLSCLSWIIDSFLWIISCVSVSLADQPFIVNYSFRSIAFHNIFLIRLVFFVCFPVLTIPGLSVSLFLWSSIVDSYVLGNTIGLIIYSISLDLCIFFPPLPSFFASSFLFYTLWLFSKASLLLFWVYFSNI